MTRWSQAIVFFQLAVLCPLVAFGATPIAPGTDGYDARVRPFFKAHCIKCHGPDKSKGELTLHTLDGDLASGRGLERWEDVLDALEFGAMPPEDETQPDEVERKVVTDWINNGLRTYVEKASREAPGTTARRLTNFEYENTMRDLLGVDLNLIQDLPKDPLKPYHFNNTAEFMLLGPEQIDRYLEVARRAMASAIVDPEKPETHKSRQQWDSGESHKGFARSLQRNEIAIQNSRRGTPGQGMGVKDFPRTGEFRIRFQASAVLPNGATELPLRFVMGYDLNINSSTQEVAPVGVVHLRNSSDNPKIYELRGRIENYPVQLGKVHKGQRRPDTLTITPQNIYDDGTLNDDNRFLYWPRQPDMPRVVIDWLEFEAPITEVWPPEHHKRILFDSPLRQSNPGKYVHEVLSRFMSRAYRRPATTEEVNRFLKVYDLLKPELGTIEATMRETLAMVLVTPQFLLHTTSVAAVARRRENAESPHALASVATNSDSHQYELASKLSYFLWGSMPDRELFELASSGDLNDPAVLATQVRRMLADPRSNDFVSNFTNQWLSLPKMKTVPINRDLFPRFLYYVEAGERAGTEKPYIPTIRDHMIDETVAFIAELIRRNASVTNLVDSDFAMLNQPLAAHYGVEGVEGQRIRPVPIKPDHHLGGLLTHGSVLIGNGTGSAPHPIYRAVWLREAILGDNVKAPPAEVPALTDSAGDSAEQALTIKDLLAKHRTVESCNDCHVRLDPWGIPFERYNAIGKYQPFVPKEGTRVRGFDQKQDNDLAGYAKYLKSVNTQEVQADARVPHGPNVDGLPQLKAHLLKSRKHDIAENVVRRLLTYAIGRELNYRDRYDVEKILSQSKDDISYLRGLDHAGGWKLGGHSSGDVFATGADMMGAEKTNNISIDQVAAQMHGHKTRYSSLVLGTEGGTGSYGACKTLSHRGPGRPIPSMHKPQEIFNRLFNPYTGKGVEQVRAGLKRDASILDLVLEHSRSFKNRLGKEDQGKVDEYLDSIRALEQRVERTSKWTHQPLPEIDTKGLNLEVSHKAPEEYIRCMYDLIYLAFQTDSTRFATLMLESEQSSDSEMWNYATYVLGYKGATHDIAHKRPADYSGQWDQWRAQQHAYFLGRLRDTPEGDGNMLDRTLVLWGSAHPHASHSTKNYPIQLAGGNHLGLEHGYLHEFVGAKKVPLANLFVSMLNAVDVPVKKFADSTGPMTELLG